MLEGMNKIERHFNWPIFRVQVFDKLLELKAGCLCDYFDCTSNHFDGSFMFRSVNACIWLKILFDPIVFWNNRVNCRSFFGGFMCFHNNQKPWTLHMSGTTLATSADSLILVGFSNCRCRSAVWARISVVRFLGRTRALHLKNKASDSSCRKLKQVIVLRTHSLGDLLSRAVTLLKWS